MQFSVDPSPPLLRGRETANSKQCQSQQKPQSPSQQVPDFLAQAKQERVSVPLQVTPGFSTCHLTSFSRRPGQEQSLHSFLLLIRKIRMSPPSPFRGPAVSSQSSPCRSETGLSFPHTSQVKTRNLRRSTLSLVLPSQVPSSPLSCPPLTTHPSSPSSLPHPLLHPLLLLTLPLSSSLSSLPPLSSHNCSPPSPSLPVRHPHLPFAFSTTSSNVVSSPSSLPSPPFLPHPLHSPSFFSFSCLNTRPFFMKRATQF